MAQELLSIADAAKRAKVSVSTIQRRIEKGDLPSIIDGVRKKVRAVDIDRCFSPSPTLKSVSCCRIIAIANQKGGVGKTTTCANLAAALAEECSVLAVDCDPQGNLTDILGIRSEEQQITLYDVLVDKIPVADAMLSPVLGLSNLTLLPANLRLSLVDRDLFSAMAREKRLQAALEPYKNAYDFILIDCPPALGLLTSNALVAATEVIIPVDMGRLALIGMSMLIDTINESRLVNPTLAEVRAVANKADNTNLALSVREALKSTFGDRMFKTVIRRSVRVGEAQTANLPITKYRPNDPAAADYMKLAKEVRESGKTDI